MNYKFRGRRIDNGEWVYGYYIKPKTTDVGLIATTTASYEDVDGEWALFDLVEVHPDSVGMWSGRVDKKETEIYDKDRLRTTTTSKRILDVFWSDKYIAFMTKDPNGEVLLNNWNLDTFEVIKDLPPQRSK